MPRISRQTPLELLCNLAYRFRKQLPVAVVTTLCLGPLGGYFLVKRFAALFADEGILFLPLALVALLLLLLVLDVVLDGYGYFFYRKKKQALVLDYVMAHPLCGYDNIMGAVIPLKTHYLLCPILEELTQTHQILALGQGDAARYRATTVAEYAQWLEEVEAAELAHWETSGPQESDD